MQEDEALAAGGAVDFSPTTTQTAVIPHHQSFGGNDSDEETEDMPKESSGASESDPLTAEKEKLYKWWDCDTQDLTHMLGALEDSTQMDERDTRLDLRNLYFNVLQDMEKTQRSKSDKVASDGQVPVGYLVAARIGKKGIYAIFACMDKPDILLDKYNAHNDDRLTQLTLYRNVRTPFPFCLEKKVREVLSFHQVVTPKMDLPIFVMQYDNLDAYFNYLHLKSESFSLRGYQEIHTLELRNMKEKLNASCLSTYQKTLKDAVDTMNSIVDVDPPSHKRKAVEDEGEDDNGRSNTIKVACQVCNSIYEYIRGKIAEMK